MQKYNIIELNEKELPDLQKIAEELGISKVSELDKQALVYRILDEQAIVLAEENKKEPKKPEGRKRGRPAKAKGAPEKPAEEPAEGELVALIKPQFEAGREFVGKKGVVRDPAVHENVIRRVTAFARELGFVAIALTFSPVKGPEGNIEYLIRLTKDQNQQDTVTEERLVTVVAEAHGALDK